MFIIFYTFVFLLGLLFWSFATVLITRWHTKEQGIIFWRSKCPKCHHTLSWYELIPLFSYALQWGKCRKCKTHIPFFYPLAEMTMGMIFLLVTFVYMRNIGYELGGQYILLLFVWFITWVYVLSDILYMEIPDEIMTPGICWYFVLLITGFFYEPITSIFFDRNSLSENYAAFVADHLSSALILYSFLFIQILIPATIALGKKGRWKDIWMLMLSYFTFFYYLIHPWKDDDVWSWDREEEIETWVGWWDLRIALFIGITLWLSHWIFAFLVAYMVGSMIGLIILAIKGKKWMRIPFAPFLATWWCMALFYHQEVIIFVEYYKSLLYF